MSLAPTPAPRRPDLASRIYQRLLRSMLPSDTCKPSPNHPTQPYCVRFGGIRVRCQMPVTWDTGFALGGRGGWGFFRAHGACRNTPLAFHINSADPPPHPLPPTPPQHSYPAVCRQYATSVVPRQGTRPHRGRVGRLRGLPQPLSEYPTVPTVQPSSWPPVLPGEPPNRLALTYGPYTVCRPPPRFPCFLALAFAPARADVCITSSRPSLPNSQPQSPRPSRLRLTGVGYHPRDHTHRPAHTPPTCVRLPHCGWPWQRRSCSATPKRRSRAAHCFGDHFSRIFKLDTTPHAPCDIRYLVAVLIGS